MKLVSPLIIFVSIFFKAITLTAQSYNPLFIPDTIMGTHFTLTVDESTKQFFSGKATNTYGINGNFLGPTLIMNQGDSVFMNVINQLADTTTMHWHGFHIPAIMDGGPHQPIPPGTTWSPYFKVANKAATYWYHPHLHMMTENQMLMGLAGMIIIRDSIEASLSLPRTYGVDDFPLILLDRKFDNLNQLLDGAYGDTMLVNGTLYPEVSMPAQYVRLRFLNANHERSYNIGFSDNRTFYVITSDGGLLDAPVPVTRYLLSVGERVEIVVDFTAQQNSKVDVMAYNANLADYVPGNEPVNSPPPFGNALGARDFMILHINVAAQTSNLVISIPTSLTSNQFYQENSATVTRFLQINNDPVTKAFQFNGEFFNMDSINQYVNLNATEIWEIENISTIAHPFHIHDIEFSILSRNGQDPAKEEQGWKDVVLVNKNETVRFITKFTDFADSIHPYMYHCHIAAHEDDGLMGQFVVIDSSLVTGNANSLINNTAINIYPNPSHSFINVKCNNKIVSQINLAIFNAMGQLVYQNRKVDKVNPFQIDISNFQEGIYNLKLYSKEGIVNSKFVVKK